jgi:hypothetical protein
MSNPSLMSLLNNGDPYPVPKLSKEEMANVRAATAKLRYTRNLAIRPGEVEVLANITHYELRNHRMHGEKFASKAEALKERDRRRALGIRCAVYAAGLLPSRGEGVTGIAGPIED